MKTLNRRTLLKGMLGAAAISVALPPLEAMMNANGTAYAGGTSFPKRFGVWFWGNGVVPDQWPPGTEGANWTPSSLLMPLMPVRENLTVITGTRVATLNTVPHGSGPAGVLTGDALMNGQFSRPSLDQVIAEQVGGDTRFRSLETGVQPSSSGFSYAGAGQLNPPETNPRALFNRLFGEGFRAPGEMTMADPRLRLRRSVLDAVAGQAGRLQGRLGAADRARLEQHLDGVRTIERQLQRLEENPPNLAACMRPAMPMESYPPVGGRPQVHEISRVISDLTVMALACDQTRVFSHMYSQPVSNVLYPEATAGHHQLTHDEPGEQREVQAIIRLILGDLAYFLTAMRNVREGDGTLLDHSLVLCMSDCSYGRTHSLDDYPLMVAGTCNGAVRQGLHLRARGENTSKVVLALLQAMGVRAAEYGVGPGRVTDVVSGLLA
ncbi:MAG: DUF1552 domain-containing protein [Polyangiales bacterium]